jgi:HEAT repeat protein
MARKIVNSDDAKLNAALTALRSEDVLTQNEGVSAAIRIGDAAVPGLLSLLEERGINRAQVMYALAQIGDTRAEPAFLAGLRDRDERVRAYSAQGLVRIDHPDAMAACFQTLNDAADELHLDRTPSVEALGMMGLQAVPLLLDALMDNDEMTRLHAQRALELLLSRRHGFHPGQGFPSTEATEGMRTEWQNLGDYDFTADEQHRGDAIAKWRRWLTDSLE